MNGVRRFLGGGGLTESPGPPAPLDLDSGLGSPPSSAAPSASTASAYSMPSTSSSAGLASAGMGLGLLSAGLAASNSTTTTMNGSGTSGLNSLGTTAALFLKKNKSKKGSMSTSSSGSMGAEDLGPWVSKANRSENGNGSGQPTKGTGAGSSGGLRMDTITKTDMRTRGRERTGSDVEAPKSSPAPRPQRTVRDDLLLSLLASEAVVESREFYILSLEEVEEYKKEETLLTSRLSGLSKKLETEGKIRDAAITLSSLSAPTKSKSTNPNASSDQLTAATLRFETTQKEFYRVLQLKADVSRKLLEHRAGVLGESVRRVEEAQAQQQQQQNGSEAPRSVRDSGYDTPTSPSPFDSFSFFAGHPSSAVPVSAKEKEKETISTLETQLSSLENKHKAELRMAHLEKQQGGDDAGNGTERDFNAERKGWELERTEFATHRTEFEAHKARMIEEKERLEEQMRITTTQGGSRDTEVRLAMQKMRDELEAKNAQLEAKDVHVGQVEVGMREMEGRVEEMRGALEELQGVYGQLQGAHGQVEADVSSAMAFMRSLIQTHNIPVPSFITNLSSSSSLSSLLEAISAHIESLKSRVIGLEQSQTEYRRKEELWTRKEGEYRVLEESIAQRDMEYARKESDYGSKEQEYARIQAEYRRKEEGWEAQKRRLEEDVRAGMDKREALSRELDGVRREVLEMRMVAGAGVGAGKAMRDSSGLRSPTSPTITSTPLTQQAFPFPPPASLTSTTPSTPTTLVNDATMATESKSPEAQSILSLLKPLWAILPSPEARAAKFASSRERGFRAGSGPSSPTIGNRDRDGPVSPGGGAGAKSISDLDVRSLKSLYDTSSNPNSTSTSAEPFTLPSFITRIHSLLADDRLLIERLLRFAQAHDLLKKNAERAQKLAVESNGALETYQRQVRVLEERNGELGRRVGECQDELVSLQDIIDRISSAKSDLEIHAAEQAETCRQLTEANNTLSARALLLAEEAAEAQAKARTAQTGSSSYSSSSDSANAALRAELAKLQTELEKVRKELKDAVEEMEATRSSSSAQNVMLMEELMVTQTENAELRGQLRGLKGK
ncbi:hypothetical protein BT96DRAFT_1026097 [Gymnopus androsaceus JB14]|uniref:Up-regulated during septation protein 1 domain-containing protein n=1 Tax=Gymnopus androsaceus JB14 TaxID=1447944 RepID=A0A6A4GNI2_9AGAR|nr:hypothetical protein BT96DRAFT_1026097 [Gymnopus androsaceus JB14]